MIDDRAAVGADALLTTEERQEAGAVFPCALPRLHAEGISGRGEDVSETDRHLAARARLDDAGPAHEEGDAVAALPDVSRVPAPIRAQINTARLELAEQGLVRGAVVAGEDDQRVVRHAELLERAQHLSDTPVSLQEEVRIEADAALTKEGLRGSDRRVRRGHREVEEEGLLFLGAVTDVMDATTRDLREDSPKTPALDLRPRGDADHLPAGLRRLGNSQGAVVLDPDIRRPVRDVVPEVVVEARLERAAADGLGVVDLCGLRRHSPTLLGPAPAEVPLADAGRVTTRRCAEVRDGQPVLGDERALPLADDPRLEATTP